ARVSCTLGVAGQLRSRLTTIVVANLERSSLEASAEAPRRSSHNSLPRRPQPPPNPPRRCCVGRTDAGRGEPTPAGALQPLDTLAGGGAQRVAQVERARRGC